MPRLSVVIPTWNGKALLVDALDSLAGQTFRDFETIVIDNGSVDGTADFLSLDYPCARLIRFAENRGFAAAVNEGIRAARGDVVVLMNNDTVADPGWLAALAEALEEHPEISSCASRMLDFTDRTRVDGLGDQMALQATPIARGETDGPHFSRERYVFSPCGGAAAYRRELFEEIGLFDERYFAYFEDVDLGFRAQIAGHKCLYVPDAVIYHRGGATSNRVSDTRAFWLTRNTLYLFFQNMPASILWRHGWFMLLWPFVDAVRHGRSLRIAGRGWLAFVRDLPAVIRRRREAYARRRISSMELRSSLSLPTRGPATAASPAPSPESKERS